MAVRPAENVLILHMLAAVEDVLAEYHAALLGGDHT
ncbi:hypothetical protein FHX42_001336 [Saccharopolyspora lacisalsi]|uniref:Uncharacterized protein n=1 Tax=Halosaccharopolyspora lacisalsi TaxID=1000566 RepID=A0A839DX34_9PSEU|nr:hypothetical protein [Halosaccharopolyspora lacisalsi]